MPFRPALPMNRANLRCLGLAVGIAIALAGCEAGSIIAGGDSYRRAFRECFNHSVGTSAAVEECRAYAAEAVARDASGMAARQRRDATRLDPKGNSPAPEGGGAQ